VVRNGQFRLPLPEWTSFNVQLLLHWAQPADIAPEMGFAQRDDHWDVLAWQALC
jgi:hypothetical protein